MNRERRLKFRLMKRSMAVWWNRQRILPIYLALVLLLASNELLKLL